MNHSGHLQVETRDAGNAVVVRPRGTVDLVSSPILRKTLLRALRHPSRNVVVDLADVEYMDSSGLATLVESFQRVTRLKGALRLAALPSGVRLVIELSRLNRLFLIDETVEQALKHFGVVQP